MAKNLRAKLPIEDTLMIHDINTEATAKLKSEMSAAQTGIVIAGSVREVAEKADTIITTLPEPSHVMNVYSSMLRPPTLLKDGFPGERLFIDCSTIDPMTSREVANAVHSSGQGRFIDAPMSGGVVGAEAGTLTFMIGAAPDLVSRAIEVLAMMGRRTLHLGEQGAGLKGKLANNYLLALNNIATAEAMNMGIRWGLDAKALAGMINISTGRCWPSEVNNPVPGVVDGSPACKDYDGGFGVALANKDLSLALKSCKEYGIPTALGDSAKALYDSVQSDPACRSKDFSVVYRYLGGKE